MIFRLYKPKDHPALLSIFQLNTPAFFAKEEQKDFEAYLDKFADTYFVAEQDGQLLGAGGYHLRENKTIGRLSWYLLHPDAKGKGVGKKLVLQCLKAIKQEKNIQKLSVWTSQLAYQFFGKFGFETVEIKKDYWGEGLDLYRMEMLKT